MEDGDDSFFNEDGRIPSVREESAESTKGIKIAIIIISILYGAFLVYYLGYVMVLTNPQHEFTGWGKGAPVPGDVFIDRRWNWQHWFIGLLAVNLFVPLVALWAVRSITSLGRLELSQFISSVLFFVPTLITAVVMIVMWATANSSFRPGNIFNSVDFCCKYFGDQPEWCRNFNLCMDTALPADISLSINSVAVQHLVAVLLLLLFDIIITTLLSIAKRHANRLLLSSDDSWGSGSGSGSGSSNLNPGKERSVSNYKGYSTALTVFNVFYTFAAIIFIIWGLYPLNVRHVHQFPATGPVGVQSARGGIEAIGMIVAGSVVFMPVLVLLIQMAGGRNRWITDMLIVIAVLLVTAHIFSFLSMIFGIGRANMPGNPNGLANSLWYCCAADIQNDPASQCDNVGISCTPPYPNWPGVTNTFSKIADLSTNFNHKLIFGFMIGFLVMDVIILTLLMVYSMRDDSRWGDKNPLKYIEGSLGKVADFLYGKRAYKIKQQQHQSSFNTGEFAIVHSQDQSVPSLINRRPVQYAGNV